MSDAADHGLRRRSTSASLMRWLLAMVVIAAVVFVVLVVRGCSQLSVGKDIGDGTVGVQITNECALVVSAAAGDSEQDALTRLEDDPISIRQGRSTMISLVTNSAYQPTRYVLAYRIGEQEAVVQEFRLDDIDGSLTIVSISKACVAEFPAAP
ncbi:MAG: hypothetical protein R2694_00215 [Ilumatobacteraceae bacterium]|nr:hypothetical protein [Ilumatobacter sp.]MCB0984615.1 hypothetical protein [Ilumatobacter sp.]